MFNFFCYVVGPEDSVYSHKLVKLKFTIPSNYPLEPPKVEFIQHLGERIHPNLYVAGKVCLSILGTWPGEPWAFGMNTNSVLITIRSLLDNKPYLHEPGKQDHPQFNEYVRYHTWRWLLLDYVEKETHPPAKAWLQKYLVKNGRDMMTELDRQRAMSQQCRRMHFTSPYPPDRTLTSQDRGTVTRNADYPSLSKALHDAIVAAGAAGPSAVAATLPPPPPRSDPATSRKRKDTPVPSDTIDASSSPTAAVRHSAQKLADQTGFVDLAHEDHASGKEAYDLERPSEAIIVSPNPAAEQPPKKKSRKNEIIDLT